MNKTTLIEVVDKLTGSCYPYGDTNIDKERLENIELKMELAKSLIIEIEESSHLRNRGEFSIKNISTKAYEFLLDTKDFIDDALGEEK